ncbi:uncharacterized protein LOC144360010 [Saccoglossus kowalevskii]
MANPVTKGDIYHLVVQCKQEKNFSVHYVAEQLRKKYPSIRDGGASDATLYNRSKAIFLKTSKLNSNRKYAARELFMKDVFVLPSKSSNEESRLTSAITVKEVALSKALVNTTAENRILKRKINDVEDDNTDLSTNLSALEVKYSTLLYTMDQVNDRILSLNGEGIHDELMKLRDDYDKNAALLDKTQSNLVAMKTRLNNNKARNWNKKLKRRDSTISNLKNIVDESKEEIVKVRKEANDDAVEVLSVRQSLSLKNDELHNAKLVIEKLKADKTKLRKKLNYYMNKTKNSSDDSSLTNNLHQRISELEKDNAEMQKLAEILESEEIETFCEGKYRDEVREVVMDMLSMNVSMNAVNNVISTVLQKLAGRNVGRLPSNALKSTLLVEAKHIAAVQVAEAMSSSSNHCLHQDGTSKFHKHYQGYQVTLSSGRTMTLGMQQLSGGTTSDIVDAFKDTIGDLADTIVSDNADKETITAQLITSLTSTMSDQGPTSATFNQQIDALKEKLLPKVTKNWDIISSANKEKLTKMFNFYCKAHILPNFASESDKVLKLLENIALDGYKPVYAMETSESGAARLVRTAVKAFHPRGCEESGVASHFLSFLSAKDEKLMLQPYKGNRFNILYYDAAAVYYHSSDISQFVAKWPNPNRLLSAVAEDLSVKVYIAELRALGIIDKVVTGPYWRITEKVEGILGMNKHLLQMKMMLERWSKDAAPVLDGELMFSEDDAEVHRDHLYEKLFAETSDAELDSMTIQALELIMHALLLILERQCDDQLPGGKYWNMKNEEQASVAAVPTTNVAGERDFAILDLLVRIKPAATTLCYETLIMWSNNKTREWLDNKDPIEKEKLMADARRTAPSYKEKYQRRMKVIQERKLEILKKKQAEKERTEQKQYTKKVQLTNQIDSVWASVDDHLNNMTEKEQRAAVVLQLNFHKTVLKSKGAKELFQQSFKRRQYTLAELINNLKEIIRGNPATECDDTQQHTSMRQADEIEVQFTIQKQKLDAKLHEMRRKRRIKKQLELLPSFEKDPNLLVNRRVFHKCVEEGSSDIEWFAARVLALVNINKDNPLKCEYCIKYDEEDDETTWHFPLLRDLKKGDLLLDEMF